VSLTTIYFTRNAAHPEKNVGFGTKYLAACPANGGPAWLKLKFYFFIFKDDHFVRHIQLYMDMIIFLIFPLVGRKMRVHNIEYMLMALFVLRWCNDKGFCYTL
jgi:hypothetical protein